MKLFAVIVLLASTVCEAADGRAAAYARSLIQAGLDVDACYRVRDLAFQKEDLRFYLNEGFLIFSKPVEGRRTSAIFTAGTAGGDAEVILLPPLRSERLSLAQFAKTPNLNEHFDAALFVFSDGTAEELIQSIESQNPKKTPEIGTTMVSTFGDTLKNLTESYLIRLVQDRFSANPDETGLFYAAVNGRQLRAFDLIMDRRGRDQIVAGQIAYRQDRRYFDVWTSFQARSNRSGTRKPAASGVRLSDVRINATLDPPDLMLRAKTTTGVTALTGGDTAVAFDLSRRVRITGVLVDGAPAEFFSHESLRANMLHGSGDNITWLVMMPKPLVKGEKHRIEFSHEGSVVSFAGNGVYFVASRMNWYPNREAEFANYDVTFRCPKNLTLVATGDVVEEHVEGDSRVVRHATSSPVRFAGFNLGEFRRITSTVGGIKLEVCANRGIEAALQPRREVTVPIPPLPRTGRRSQGLPPSPSDLPVVAPNPASRFEQLNTEITAALAWLSTHFGPPPLKLLSVAPIPGTFGQGFPGLLYLSTLAYLNPSDRPMPLQTEPNRIFFSELLHAHETAHQWWGNLVTSGHYQDDWLMEGLASYSALLVLEQRKGGRALETVLDEYRQDLLKKTEGEKTIESAGPVVWGMRLNSSLSPTAWRTIVYEKGSWVMHMLRQRMGDERFLRMLGEIVRRKQYSTLSTEEFRNISAEFLPAGSDDPKLENFFDTWVYNTGIPSLKLSYKVEGKAPKFRVRGSLTQRDIGEEFSTAVPVEIQFAGRRAVTKWIHTSGEENVFAFDVAQAPVKVVLDPRYAVLSRGK